MSCCTIHDYQDSKQLSPLIASLLGKLLLKLFKY